MLQRRPAQRLLQGCAGSGSPEHRQMRRRQMPVPKQPPAAHARPPQICLLSQRQAALPFQSDEAPCSRRPAAGRQRSGSLRRGTCGGGSCCRSAARRSGR